MKIELMGWGSERGHNATNIFHTKKLSIPTIKVGKKKIKVNTCNMCGKEIPKRWRYCVKCKKKRQKESQNKWRRNRC